MRVKHIFTSLVSCLLLLTCNSLSAFAEVALPDGAVKGLPERLTAMDSDGNVVSSATGVFLPGRGHELRRDLHQGCPANESP